MLPVHLPLHLIQHHTKPKHESGMQIKVQVYYNMQLHVPFLLHYNPFFASSVVCCYIIPEQPVNNFNAFPL